jgi:hypothetical protein
MARNRHAAEENRDAAPPPQSAVAKVAGGAGGVPENAADRQADQGAKARARAAVPRPKRYRVTNGGMIVYNNCRTAMRAGKEVSEAQFDLALLRRQGIRLEEIIDDPVPEPAKEEAEPVVEAAPKPAEEPRQTA